VLAIAGEPFSSAAPTRTFVPVGCIRRPPIVRNGRRFTSAHSRHRCESTRAGSEIGVISEPTASSGMPRRPPSPSSRASGMPRSISTHKAVTPPALSHRSDPPLQLVERPSPAMVPSLRVTHGPPALDRYRADPAVICHDSELLSGAFGPSQNNGKYCLTSPSPSCPLTPVSGLPSRLAARVSRGTWLGPRVVRTRNYPV
jgi:hypothetical protein